MTAVALITFWQLAGVVLPILGAIAVTSFFIWCAVGLVLWSTGRGFDTSVQAETDPEWFDSL